MDNWKIAIGLVLFVIVALLAVSGGRRGASGEDDAINITEKDLPKMPGIQQIDLPNASIEIPFVARHELAGNITIDDIKFTTVDGVSIAGTLYMPLNSKPKSVVVLVHQLGSSRKTYEPIAPTLARGGAAVLAIDMRGHGESGYKGGHSSFSSEDWLSVKKDIDGAFGALNEKTGDGKLPSGLVGASIGANLALQYAAENKRNLSKVVLLSPGLDFRGITTEEAAKKYFGSALILASEEDLYSFDSAQKLQEINPAIEVANYTGFGHGTEMLKSGEVRKKLLQFMLD